jgi:hypothetical protein
LAERRQESAAGPQSEDAAEHSRGTAAGDRARCARPPTDIKEPDSVPELARRPRRLPQLRPSPLEAGPDEGRDRAVASSLRPSSHLRNLRATRRRLSVCGLAVHGVEHRNDRPPLWAPRRRQSRTRRLASRRARARAGRGRWVDVATEAPKTAQRQRSHASHEAIPASGGRPVDAETCNCRPAHNQKELNSRHFVKPSNGLEPLTPSLPFATDCHRLQPRGSIKAPSDVASSGYCALQGWPPVATAEIHKAPRRGNRRRRTYGLGRRALPFPPSLNVAA